MNLNQLTNRFNPFTKLFKIKSRKRNFDKMGIEDPVEFVDSLWYTDPVFGDIKMAAEGFVMTTMTAFIFTIVVTLKGFTGVEGRLNLAYFIVPLLFSLMVVFYFSRKNKDLVYFKAYDNWSKSKFRRYSLFSWLIVVFSYTCFILALDL